MKNYIDVNIECRMKSNNKLEENFYKLTNNSIYEKQWKIENIKTL